MNREIKFRIWHNNEMYHRHDKKGNTIIRNGGYVILEQPSPMPLFSGELIGLDGAVLMQYIGLKDKNEKEIYEGDIVEIADEYFKIYFNERSAGFQLDKLGMHQGGNEFISNVINELEVIGNIYENPELLK